MSITVIANVSQVSATGASAAGSTGQPVSPGGIDGDFAAILAALPTTHAVVSREPELREQEETRAGESSLPGDPALLILPGTTLPPVTSAAMIRLPPAAQGDAADRAAVSANPPSLSPLLAELAAGSPRLATGNAEEGTAKLAVASVAGQGLVASGFDAQPATPAASDRLDVQLAPTAFAPPSPAPPLLAAAAPAAGESQGLVHHLPILLRDPAWPTELGQRLLWFAGNDRQFAQVSVNPPELGSVEVTLRIDASGASAHFAAANAEVRSAIENSLPRLREMFASAGLDLGQVSVGNQSSGQASEQRHEAAKQPRTEADRAILALDSMNRLPPAARVARHGTTLVDVFV